MAVQVYLNFNGNCKEAVEFYSDVFKTNEPQFMYFGDVHQESDFALDDSAKNMVMHTYLMISGSKVMFSDVPPGMPFVQGNNISLTIVSREEAEIRSAYERLKDGGSVIMDMQETFWSKCYANLVDKYGINWQLSLESDQQ